jgi:hypothetical protein
MDDKKIMNYSVLFESFIVFYLIEIMVLVSVYFFFIKQKIVNETKLEIEEASNGPAASDLIKMRSIAKQLERVK